MTFKEKLIELNACKAARDWAGDKDWAEVHATCPRGEWLLWLYEITNPEDKRGLALAAALCANTVRHLMQDPRSIAAVDAAIAYGRGEIDEDELDTAQWAALAAAVAEEAAETYAETYAEMYAARAAAKAPAAEWAAAEWAAEAIYKVAHSPKLKIANQFLTADIVRETLPIEKWNVN